jgi:hypothetical protein
VALNPGPILVVTGPAGVGKSTVSRLVAGAFDRSAHVRVDDVMSFVVSGWVQPSSPEAEHQNGVIGCAVVASALQFAEGGYTTVVDGHLFREFLGALAPACLVRRVPLHHAILRADLATCLERAAARTPATRVDRGPFVDLHRRFDELGDLEAHAVDATGPPEQVAAAVLAAFRAGALVVGGASG